jgi:hypothetical protein
LKIAMTADELRMFYGVLGCTRRYVEFGSGGSTVLAAGLVQESVVSFDSSREWLDRVAAACRKNNTRLTPELIFLDIGEIGDWGFPRDDAAQIRWPDYHSGMWGDPRHAAADLYLIDGRFRVACCAQILLHAGGEALIAFHDYALRPHYHRVAEIAREIARVNDLSIFIRRSDFDRRAALNLLEDHAYDPR